MDTTTAANVLARAFYDDPVVKFTWPNDAKRAKQTEACFGTQLRVLADRLEVDADSTASSVAVWARPDEWKVPFGSSLRMLLPFLRNGVRMRSMVALAEIDKLHPDEPHYYLDYLGTVPEQQGRGLGGHALAPLLARADAEGLPVWAFSSNRQNLAFYHRHGFVVLDELPLAKNGPPIFPIKREPAPL